MPRLGVSQAKKLRSPVTQADGALGLRKPGGELPIGPFPFPPDTSGVLTAIGSDRLFRHHTERYLISRHVKFGRPLRSCVRSRRVLGGYRGGHENITGHSHALFPSRRPPKRNGRAGSPFGAVGQCGTPFPGFAAGFSAPLMASAVL